MATIGDATNGRIANRLRLERDARGWSLAEVAGRSGVAKATISKIEREEMSPTAVILVRLAGAFDLTLAGLLLRAEGELDRLSRAADQPVWRDPDTGSVRTQVFSRPDHPVEIVRVEMPAGQRHVLGPGDCLGYGPPGEVTMANESPTPCTYLVLLARM
jgi:transcriptional regulator with XRE-family HTH domain